jgi:hypothetical protein
MSMEGNPKARTYVRRERDGMSVPEFNERLPHRRDPNSWYLTDSATFI